jgi:hypothetical protein
LFGEFLQLIAVELLMGAGEAGALLLVVLLDCLLQKASSLFAVSWVTRR